METFFMKPLLLSSFVLLLAGLSANAQFSLLPQAGFEQSRTALDYGNGLSALNSQGYLKAALKLDYKLKGGHSPFINLATTPAPVSFVFDGTGALVNQSQSATPKFRLEAGYQYSSKPIFFGKESSTANSTTKAAEASAVQQNRCGSMYKSRCGQRRTMNKATPANNPLNLRLQPAVALAYVPWASESVTPKGDGFEYKAAAWKTAIVPSMGFEFAKGNQRLFSLNVFYTKPLAETNEMGTVSPGAKATSVPLQARTSTWGMTLGIPISFAKSTQSKPAVERKECHRNYYRRCMRVQ
jgi:hypothetical protein